MSRSVNMVVLMGNVGQDPEIRATSSGARVAKISLATNDYAGKDRPPKANWHRLTVFGRLVDVVEQYVRKGDRLYIRGRLDYSQTQDDHGGTKYWTNIIVDDLVMTGAGTSAGGDYVHQDQGATVGGGAREVDDDLPF